MMNGNMHVIGRWCIIGLMWCSMILDGAATQIMEATTFQDIDSQINHHLSQHFIDPGDVLCVFDIDLVLTRPSILAANMPAMRQHRKALKHIFKDITLSQRNIAYNFATHQSTPLLVDDKAPHYIKKLRQKGIKSIALTAVITGRLGDIARVERHRYHVLKQLGIDFSSSYPSLDDITFEHLDHERHRYPVYYQGILTSSFIGPACSTKSTVLNAFFESAQHHPKLVVFVDDRLSNVKEMVSGLNQDRDHHIDVLGIQFTGAQHIQLPDITQSEFTSFWQAMIDKARSEFPDNDR